MAKKKPVQYMLIGSAVILFIFLIMQPLQVYLFSHNIALLFPKGIIGIEERDLLLFLQVLMLIVIIPVYILTFIFSWKYNAANPHGTYDPDLVDHKLAEVIWWGIPIVMTLIASVITYVKTYELDPYKSLSETKKPLTIQVVALQWKWLFIYPEEKIASLNFLQIPKDTPIHFEITADAPMNSLWIPRLGGQIYAMPMMRTELHLVADEVGDFRGSSANLSGEGFADMYFTTRASSEKDFQDWVGKAKTSAKNLDAKEYEKLALPSRGNSPETYQLADENLFNQIIMKYMHPGIKEHVR